MRIGFPKKIPPPIDQSCVGYWKFDEASGNIKDWSGNVNTGVAYNLTYSQAGKFGNVCSFNGTNAWVIVADSNVLDIVGPFTITTWIYRIGSYSNQEIISKVNYGANSRCYELAIGTNNTIRVGFTTDGTANTWITGSGNTPIPQSSWTHIVGTYDSVSLKVYINGTLDGESNVGAIVIYSGTAGVSIGRHGESGNFFNGLMDDVRIYNRALSTQEIKRHYMAGR